MDKFIVGLILCAVINGLFMRDTIYLTTTNEIVETINKCSNSNYDKLILKAQSASYLHGQTIVFCSDGTVVKRYAGK